MKNIQQKHLDEQLLKNFSTMIIKKNIQRKKHSDEQLLRNFSIRKSSENIQTHFWI